VLGRRFRCYAIDLPGQGDSPAAAGPPTPAGGAAALLATLAARRLLPAAAVGNSAGGAAAVLAEAQRPGSFLAIFAYEPVAAPDADAPDAAAAAAGGSGRGGESGGAPPSSGSAPLAAMARRRRRAFPSRAAAAQSLAGRPPFSLLDPECRRLYFAHGLRDAPGGGVELKCGPETEAAMFESHDPAPPVDPRRVRCPVAVAAGRSTPGSLHARLPALAAELAAALPAGSLHAFPELTHLGPLEDPRRVGAAALAFFEAAGAAGAAGGPPPRQQRSRL